MNKLFNVFFLCLLCFSLKAWSEPRDPFEVARQIGNNLARDYTAVQEQNAIQWERQREQNSIADMLKYANETENPKDIQKCISYVLCYVSPERQTQILIYLQNRYEQLSKKQ